MLTNIENRLEELFEMIELLPADKVEAAEKVGHFNVVLQICRTVLQRIAAS